MSYSVFSAVTDGPIFIPVTVEVQISRTSLPNIKIIGLAKQEVQESKVRVISALKQAGFQLPRARITINLQPLEVNKQGASLDLAMAMGILGACGQIKQTNITAVGAVNLGGEVLPVKNGWWLVSQLAKQRQTILMPDLSLPTDWQPEFYANLRTIKNLRQLATWQFGSPSRCQNKSSYDSTNLFPTGLISSQLLQILKVILVGGHHALLIGEPGTGKSFITQIVPYLQASLNPRQEWEKTLFQQQFQIKSDSIMVLADQTDSFAGLFGSVRPWQAGKINAANYGIMIADELPLWSKRNLDGLLAPMAQLPRTLFYKQNSLQIFSNLSVVGLANPCPCSQSSNSICQCNLATIHKYKSKFSAALLDRFAIQWRIGCHDLTKMRTTEWLQAKKQIISARKIQNQRINLGFPHQASLYNQEQVLQLLPSFGQTGQDELNWRKRLQIAQVGITLADLDAQPVTKSHLQLAKLLTQNIWGQD